MSECIEWLGHVQTAGYGQFKRNGREILAHRDAYEKAHGPIPPGVLVLHSCDNRKCINPDHLRLGTAKDNFGDMIKRSRYRHHRQGRKLNPESVKELRSLREGGATLTELATRFGISNRQASRIARGLSWASVTP